MPEPLFWAFGGATDVSVTSRATATEPVDVNHHTLHENTGGVDPRSKTRQSLLVAL